jgi:hypothetical protein
MPTSEAPRLSHYKNPPQFHAAKNLLDQGVEQPLLRRAPRPFFCRTCGKEENSLTIPEGWYLLQRKIGDTVPNLRLGIFCSIDCIDEQLPRLRNIAIQADVGLRHTQYQYRHQDTDPS